MEAGVADDVAEPGEQADDAVVMDGREEVGQIELEQDRRATVLGRVGRSRAARDEAVGSIVDRNLGQDAVENLSLHPPKLSLGGTDDAFPAVALGNAEARVRALVVVAGKQEVPELPLRADAEQL